MNKNSKFMKYFVLPLSFGLISLLASFIIAHLVTYLIFLIPHYSYTKEGSFSILLAILLGIPIGFVFYFLFYFINNVKKRIILLLAIIFCIFSSLTLYDLIDGSCNSMSYQKKWNGKLDTKESQYIIWSKVCR